MQLQAGSEADREEKRLLFMGRWKADREGDAGSRPRNEEKNGRQEVKTSAQNYLIKLRF